MPSIGDEAEAKRFLGMRPARYASRPPSIAFFIADAIKTGCFAAAIAVFISMPSQPNSIAIAASPDLFHYLVHFPLHELCNQSQFLGDDAIRAGAVDVPVSK